MNTVFNVAASRAGGGRAAVETSTLEQESSSMFAFARRRFVLLSFACSLVALVCAPAGAQASFFNGCGNPSLNQPFSPWLDYSSYELAPGGDFENNSWTLSGGAAIVAGSEPFAATGTLGHSSLSLPAGATAVSPSACVSAAYPTLRAFVGGTGSVAVSVVYGGVTIPTGVAISAGQWVPTAPMLTQSAIPGLFGGGTAQVSLELTGLTGTPQVDDVFIDPWGGHA
jgi:hypothetical protein